MTPTRLLMTSVLLFFVLILRIDAGIAAVDQAENEASTETEIENLFAFTRLFGYVRYFHPSDEASDIDWERFAILGSRMTVSANDSDELRRRLEALFLPIAPSIQLYSEGEAPQPHRIPTHLGDHDQLRTVAWQHQGVERNGSIAYRSIRLNRGAHTSASVRFTQQVDVDQAESELKLMAMVRIGETRGEGARLWVGNVFTDADSKRGDWQPVQVITAIEADAEPVRIGGSLDGHGQVWFDDFQLFTRENTSQSWRQLPLDNADFEQGRPGPVPQAWEVQTTGGRLAITATVAHGGERSLRATIPLQVEPPLFDAQPEPGSAFTKPLARGLNVRIPLALPDIEGRTWRPEEAPDRDMLIEQLRSIDPTTLDATDPALRRAGVAIAWNVFQHFYPYFDVVPVAWDSILRMTLRRTRNDSTTGEYLASLRWMIAHLQDGHGNVNHTLNFVEALPTFMVDLVEDSIVIVAVADETESSCLRRGDVVIAIDGVPSTRLLDESMQYISGSPQWRRHRALHMFGLGERGSVADVSAARHADDASATSVRCAVVRDRAYPLHETRPAPIDTLDEGIEYIDLSRASMTQIEERIPTLAGARGIVFDLRGYPNGTHDVLRYLTDVPLESPMWRAPRQIHPDQDGPISYRTSNWTLDPAQIRFRGQAVLLTNASAISYSETILGIVAHYRLGDIVGQATAGANGDVNWFTLPGGYTIHWTGARVLKHDDGQHHLVGIQPTLPVERSLVAVREGRDEYLEAALALILSP